MWIVKWKAYLDLLKSPITLFALTLLVLGLTLCPGIAHAHEIENNDTRQNATVIMPNQTVIGNLQTSDDVDYYKFEIPSSGKVHAVLKHEQVDSGSWAVSILDMSNNYLGGLTAQGNELNISSYYLRLPAGTYYVKVNRNYYYSNVNYELAVNFAAEDETYEKEFNNLMSTADPIDINTTITGNLQCKDDVDYYKFEIPSAGKVYAVIKHAQVDSGSWVVSILDISNNNLGGVTVQGNNLNNRSCYLRLPAGTYYIKVHRDYYYSDIDYQITVNFAAEDETYEKEFNNSMSNADPIDVNMTITGNLQFNDDIDYYKFEIPSAGKVYTVIKHEQVDSGSWVVSILDINNDSLGGVKVQGNNLNKRSCYLRLPAGTYYVKVHRDYYYNDIDYQITVNFTAEDETYEKEFNNFMSTAYSIDINTTITGNLQCNDDVDYYKFEIPSAGKVYAVIKHEQVDSGSWVVSILDINNDSLGGVTVQGNNLNNRSYFLRLPAGTYYIKVNRDYYYNDIDYQTTVNFSAENEFYEKESNNSLTKANSIQVNQTLTGNLQSRNDIDYYKFTIGTTTSAHINLGHDLVDSGSWVVTLLDANNQSMTKFTVNSYETSKDSSAITLSPGSYYIKVTRDYYMSDVDYHLTVLTPQYIPVQSIAISQSTLDLIVGGSPVTLNVSISPANASNHALKWSSSNPQVAIVENGKVTPIAIGQAIITAESLDNPISVTCSVLVSGDDNSNWHEIPGGRTVAGNYQWTVKFNKKINPQTVSGNIYVKDAQGQIVPTYLQVMSDGQSVKIIPQNNYTGGKKYYIYVAPKLSSQDGKTLQQGVRMVFSVY